MATFVLCVVTETYSSSNGVHLKRSHLHLSVSPLVPAPVLWGGRSLFQPVYLYPLSHSTAAATGTQWRMNQAAETENATLPSFYFFTHICLFTFFSPPLPPALNVEELIFTFCRQHPFLFIFLPMRPPPPHPTHSPTFRQGCQALPEQWGCQEWWMTINLLLSPTMLLGDLQARWLPGMKTNLFLILTSLPPSTPASLLPSFPPLFQYLLSYQKELS